MACELCKTKTDEVIKIVSEIESRELAQYVLSFTPRNTGCDCVAVIMPKRQKTFADFGLLESARQMCEHKFKRAMTEAHLGEIIGNAIAQHNFSQSGSAEESEIETIVCHGCGHPAHEANLCIVINTDGACLCQSGKVVKQ